MMFCRSMRVNHVPILTVLSESPVMIFICSVSLASSTFGCVFPSSKDSIWMKRVSLEASASSGSEPGVGSVFAKESAWL